MCVCVVFYSFYVAEVYSRASVHYFLSFCFDFPKSGLYSRAHAVDFSSAFPYVRSVGLDATLKLFWCFTFAFVDFFLGVLFLPFFSLPLSWWAQLFFLFRPPPLLTSIVVLRSFALPLCVCACVGCVGCRLLCMRIQLICLVFSFV